MSEGGQAEEPLPLRALDGALAPLRRVVRYAMRPDARPRFLEANAHRHLSKALALNLPTAIRAQLADVATHLEGFDGVEDLERRDRLSRVYAGLTRIDAVAGLPLPLPRLTPVRKPVQRDRPETEAPDAPRGRPRGRADRRRPDARSTPSEPVAPTHERFDGDLSASLRAFVPDLADALRAWPGDSVRDLVLLRPVSFETIEPIHGAGVDVPEGRVAVGGRVRGSWTVLAPDGGAVTWSRIAGSGLLRVQWAEHVRAPAADSRVVVVGDREDDMLRDAELCTAGDRRVRLARYGVPDVEDRAIRLAVSALSSGLEQVRDVAPSSLLERLALPELGAALLGAHAQGDGAFRRRLALDEALLVQLAGALPRARSARGRGIAHAIQHKFAAQVGQTLELFLDDAQQACFEEIKRELRRSTPMRRVLTGEVGAGKGRIALMTAATVAEGRAQVLMLAPDEAGVQELFFHLEPILKEGGLVSRAVPSPPTGSQRDAIRRGEVHVVIGAIDLLDHELEFRRLGLVVAHERDQWGRASQQAATMATPHPDVLVTTAVPVGPRVLFTAYAEHDVSVLVDAERRPARIQVCTAAERPHAYEQVRGATARGEQALILFPQVRGRDALDIPEAHRVVRALESDALEGCRVGLLHGATPETERRRVHEDFQRKRLDVLVATTRVEDGASLPGVTMVVIEQADKVDQVRLHRIVGFLSNATSEASALLVVGEMADDNAAARVERVVSAPDGFSLTESLVALRGTEEVVRAGAPPLPTHTWLDLDTDLDLILAARAEVGRILGADQHLRRGSHADLARELQQRWSMLWPSADPELWPCPVTDIPDDAGGGKRRRRRRRRRR